MNMGLTAEYLAMKYRIPRGRRTSSPCGAITSPARPPTRANSRTRSSRPGAATNPAGRCCSTEDQGIRRDTSLEALSRAAAGVPARGRLGHGGQQLADQRRGRRGAGDVGGEGPRAGPQAHGEGPRDGRGRGRSRGDGHRPRARRPEGPQARRADPRSDRVHRAERGVRRAGPVRAQAARASTRSGSTPAAARSRSATPWVPAAPGSPRRCSTGCATRAPSSAWRRCASARDRAWRRSTRWRSRRIAFHAEALSERFVRCGPGLAMDHPNAGREPSGRLVTGAEQEEYLYTNVHYIHRRQRGTWDISHLVESGFGQFMNFSNGLSRSS